MKIAQIFGSWPAIFAVPVLSYGLQYVGFPEQILTFQLSVMALTFTQLVLREQNKDSAIDKEIQHEQLQVEKRIEEKIEND